MITSIFSKSKPINLLVVFFISLLAFLTGYYRQDNESLTWNHGLSLSLMFFACYSALLLLDFIVNKNFLTQKHSFELLLFSLFLLAMPQAMLDVNIILAHLLVLLAFRRILNLHNQKQIKKKIFDAALLISVASLFYFWAILFFVFIFAALLFYLDNELKHWLIPIVGFIAISVLSMSYSLLRYDDFFSGLPFETQISFDFSAYNSLRFIVTLTMLLSFGIWAAVYYLPQIKKRTKAFRPNYKLVFVSCIIACIIIILAPQKDGREFLFLFAPLSILINNYIDVIEEKWFKEIFLLALIIIPISLLVL